MAGAPPADEVANVSGYLSGERSGAGGWAGRPLGGDSRPTAGEGWRWKANRALSLAGHGPRAGLSGGPRDLASAAHGGLLG